MIDFDKLATLAREAFNAQYDAGYKQSKYVHDHHHDETKLRDAKNEAQELAAGLTREFWVEFYESASEVGDALRELREQAAEWQRLSPALTEEQPAGTTLDSAARIILEILDRERD